MIHASNKPGVNGCQVYQLQLWSKNKAKIAIAPRTWKMFFSSRQNPKMTISWCVSQI